MNYDCICVGCYADFESPTRTGMEWSGDEYDGRWVGLCPQCRADLELGRLVRAMPNRSELQRLRKNDWRFFSDVVKRCEAKKTPEEALKKARNEK